MSLQGPGSGISGASNQFQCGYAQGAGYANSAGYATNAGAAANSYISSTSGGVQGAAGYIRAWRSNYGNTQGVSALQQQATNAIHIQFVTAWGSYYGVITDSLSSGTQWQQTNNQIGMYNGGQQLQNTGAVILFP
jgi:hypothetical protein